MQKQSELENIFNKAEKFRLNLKEKNSLKRILKYKNEQVIRRFESEYGFSYLESKKIFKDLLYFLWFNDWVHRYNRDKSESCRITIGIRSSLKIVDEMWHTFLLFTEDYRQFSFKYFNYFVNHVPGASLKEKLKIGKRNYFKSEAEFEHSNYWAKQKNITRQLFGASICKRWYVDLKKYDDIYIKKIQLKSKIKLLSAS